MTSNNKATAQVSQRVTRDPWEFWASHPQQRETLGWVWDHPPIPASLQLQLIYIRKFNSFPDLFWEDYIDLLHCSVLLLHDL